MLIAVPPFLFVLHTQKKSKNVQNALNHVKKLKHTNDPRPPNPELILMLVRKGSKIRLIIFAEFSAKGGGGYPPSVKIINFSTKEIVKTKSVQNALKHVIK